MAAFKDHASFSAVNAIGGLFPPLPFEPEGDDISEQIEAHRHLFPIHEHMVVMDPPQHERARSLLSKLLDAAAAQGERGLHAATGRSPDSTGSIDLVRQEMRVPLRVRQTLRHLGDHRPTGRAGGRPARVPCRSWAPSRRRVTVSGPSTDRARRARPPAVSGRQVRRVPRGAADASRAETCSPAWPPPTYPDGSTPELLEVVKPATFLFAAGQETVTKLLTAAVQTLGDYPEYQQTLRENPDGIPTFIEEALRMHSPTKIDFRPRPQDHHPRRGAPEGRDHRHAVPGCGQPRSPQVRRSTRVPARSQERPRTHRFRPGHPHLRRGRRWPGSKDRSPSAACWTGCGTSASTNPSTVRPERRNYNYEPTFLLRGLTELHITIHLSERLTGPPR